MSEIESQIRSLFGPELTHFSISLDRRAISLLRIEVAKASRRKGLGLAVIKELQRIARELDLPIVLTPEPLGRERVSKSALVRFYKRCGFRSKRRGESELPLATMVWSPKEH